jgi:hypothetical protein
MTLRSFLRGCAIVSCAAVPGIAAADSVFTVPVAGTLQPNRLTASLSGGAGANLASESSSLFSAVDYNFTRYFSAGVTTRLTNGFSARPEGSVQFAPENKPYAFAVGFGNVGVRTFRSQPYAVANTRVGDFGFYAGGTHDSYGLHPMLGTDYEISSRWSLQADWIHDDESFVTVGTRWQVKRNIAVSAGFSHSSGEEGGNGIFASVLKEFYF